MRNDQAYETDGTHDGYGCASENEHDDQADQFDQTGTLTKSDRDVFPQAKQRNGPGNEE
ncbi:hypothetical protein D1872_353650 [compost metagenome]